MKQEYDLQTGFPLDRSYLECDLPGSLQEALAKMKAAWEKIDSGIEFLRWDCDYCELQSEINCADVCSMISEEQAWYLREKYLRLKRSGEIV